MDGVADRFADRGVTSVLVYTREAHPGENYPHHTSMQVKRHNARALREYTNLRRRILLDDLDGRAHRAYGGLPNMTWIVGQGGMILYKAAWSCAADVENALTPLLEHRAGRRQQRLALFYTERISWRVDDREGLRAGLERSGPRALRDYYR